MRSVLVVALVVVSSLAAATTASAAAARTGSATATCPAPPARFKPVPFNGLTWNWEIGQWVGSCSLGLAFGPNKLASLLHLSSSNHTALAKAAAERDLTLDLHVPASKAIAERFGLTRLKQLLTTGILTGFQLRGRP